MAQTISFHGSSCYNETVAAKVGGWGGWGGWGQHLTPPSASKEKGTRKCPGPWPRGPPLRPLPPLPAPLKPRAASAEAGGTSPPLGGPQAGGGKGRRGGGAEREGGLLTWQGLIGCLQLATGKIFEGRGYGGIRSLLRCLPGEVEQQRLGSGNESCPWMDIARVCVFVM